MGKIHQKIQIWIATIVYALAVLFIIRGVSNGSGYSPYTPNDVGHYELRLFTTNFPVLSYFVLPYFTRFTILYIVFLFLILKIIPNIIYGKKRLHNTFYLIGLLFATSLVIGFGDQYLEVYLFFDKWTNTTDLYLHFFFNALLFSCIIFGLYGFYAIGLISVGRNRSISVVKRLFLWDSLSAFSIWILAASLLYDQNRNHEYLHFWIYIVLPAVLLYSFYTSSVLPKLKAAKSSKKLIFWTILKALFITNIGLVAVFSISNHFIFSYREINSLLLYSAISCFFHLLVTTPLAWYLYDYRVRHGAELNSLKVGLSQSEANIDFLRWQINPHFLFNTLNTLYGTALQDGSTRAASGIQKLGDMMRFMLDENQQETILLSKEINYLNNYIDLQILRTGQSPDIIVETDITGDPVDHRIAPMLLIPFVENAFKHGISLIKRSWVKTKLNISDKQLSFEVTNSINISDSAERPAGQSGIGQENVLKRLALIYPERHQIAIQKSENEYRVSLTLIIKP